MMKSDEKVLALVAEAVGATATLDDALSAAVGVLKQEREKYNWVGIYLLEGDTLVLHNYLGKPTEHTRIPVGRGVCGAAVAHRKNQIVADVRKLDNYLACSLETRSEIVVLIRRLDEILGQIDIDSDQPGAFASGDELLLESVASLLASRF